MDPLLLTSKVRHKALELGFSGCGFSRAEKLDREAFRLEQWLYEERHATMSWMENHFDKRIDPTKLVPGSKSVVSVIAGYRFPENETEAEKSGPTIAKYARGRDYHKVFKGKLKKLFAYTKEIAGNVQGRLFVDSAPVLDKAWAIRAGLGWMGKNGNILNQTHGSWFLIGEMIVDIPFVYDAPVTDHCGSCTRCIDACPTNAIYEPYRIDSKRCISYLTIELKEKIAEQDASMLNGWVFGCDICQDVCPWNRKAAYGQFDDLRPRQQVLNPPKNGWTSLTEKEFEDRFEGSAVRRAGYERFVHQAGLVEQRIDGS
ncbi:MAG: tRNA epoxyqueuosine(34) reductase QueG [Balneolaceae bacterium]